MRGSTGHVPRSARVPKTSTSRPRAPPINVCGSLRARVHDRVGGGHGACRAVLPRASPSRSAHGRSPPRCCCMCGGVIIWPGSSVTRCVPTRTEPAASASRCQCPAIGCTPLGNARTPRHRPSERASHADYCMLGPGVVPLPSARGPLALRPDLDLAHELAQLVEQPLPASAFARSSVSIRSSRASTARASSMQLTLTRAMCVSWLAAMQRLAACRTRAHRGSASSWRCPAAPREA